MTLILSDIIGDPLDLIASGPTIPNRDSKETALAILKKYSIDGDIPCSIKSVLRDGVGDTNGRLAEMGNEAEFGHVRSFIIGKIIELINWCNYR